MSTTNRDDMYPSHPNFDRSGMSDGEYIDRLMFEIKELRSSMERKDLLIQSLQGNMLTSVPSSSANDNSNDVPHRSARRGYTNDKDDSINNTTIDTSNVSHDSNGTSIIGNIIDDKLSDSGHTESGDLEGLKIAVDPNSTHSSQQTRQDLDKKLSRDSLGQTSSKSNDNTENISGSLHSSKLILSPRSQDTELKSQTNLPSDSKSNLSEAMSPGILRSPQEVKSPQEIKSPQEVKSSQEVRSIQESKSHQDINSPKEFKSPQEMKFPQDIQSPQDLKSPHDVKSRESSRKASPKFNAVGMSSISRQLSYKTDKEPDFSSSVSSLNRLSTSTSIDHNMTDEGTNDKDNISELHKTLDPGHDSMRSSIYSDEGKEISDNNDEEIPEQFHEKDNKPDNDDKQFKEKNRLSIGNSTIGSISSGGNTMQGELESTLSPSRSIENSANMSHLNQSSSSFQSYKSRIRLPHTMQQHQPQVSQQPEQTSPPDQQNQPQFGQHSQSSQHSLQRQSSIQQKSSAEYHSSQQRLDTTSSPSHPYHQFQHHRPSHQNIHLPHTPTESQPPVQQPPPLPSAATSNTQSPSRLNTEISQDLQSNRTVSGRKDQNVKDLNLEVPTSFAHDESALRSPVIVSSNANQHSAAQQNHTTNTGFVNDINDGSRITGPPQTPEVFYSSHANDSSSKINNFNKAGGDEAMSTVSSPAPTSQYSQSPATGHSYQVGYGFENDSLRTPLTNEYATLTSLYNMKNSSKNIGSSSSFLVNRHAEEDESSLFIKPEDFQTIEIDVVSTISLTNIQTQSNITTKKLDEVFVTLRVSDRASKKEMWRIRKSYNQLVGFDSEIRPTVEYFGLPVLPDKTLFFSTTPNKIDIRRTGLQNYFNTLFVMPHIPHLILFRICKYLSLDVVNPLDDFKSGASKEGYLVRKYKGLGTSWKVRWCQVDGPTLELCEYPGGPMVELISLINSQIGRQSNDSIAEDKGYRHAFLIMESQKVSKLSGSIPKHFFCAESDEERDNWVNTLIDFTQSPNSSLPGSIAPGYDNDSVDLTTPNRKHGELPDEVDTRALKSPAGLGMEGNQANTEEEKPKDKKKTKRSIFPFRTKNSNNSSSQLAETSGDGDQTTNASGSNKSNHNPSGDSINENSIQLYLDRMNLDEDVSKSIFGREIAQAFQLSHHSFLGRDIPSICYRCVDFLIRTGALLEEGIFRLSGSASTIRQLKEAFNKEFDIDLFNHPTKPDIHTVAGLFKTYLRELPSPIITDKCHHELRSIIGSRGGKKQMDSSMALIFRDYLNNSNNIDKIHYDATYIILKLLKEIVKQHGTNKMNLRNVCIVFVPTLNISVDVLSSLLIDFLCIFENSPPIPDDTREVLDLNIPSF